MASIWNPGSPVGSTPDLISVRDYPFLARGDGTTDDTAAIQAALTAGAGRAVYIPGTLQQYIISDDVVVPPNTHVFGDFWGSRLRQITPQKNGLVLGNNCKISKLRISGDGASRNPVDFAKENGIYASGAYNIQIDQCVIDSWQSNGIQLRDCWNYSITGNVLFNQYYSFLTSPTSSCSDILTYSGANGGRAIIVGNFCFSDNSQGIFYNPIGFDKEAVIANNVCVTLNNALTAEVASAGLNRRHGIIVSYGGSSESGRIICNANVCKNTLVSGIYVAAASGGETAVSVTNNVCALNGFATVSDATLAGGISVNGAINGLVITGNVIHDFRGNPASSVGGITYNDQNLDTEASAIIANNSINGSTTYGILLKGTPKNVTISNNLIRACAGSDIAATDFTGPGIANVKNIVIKGNNTKRINTTAPNIYLDVGSSTQRVWVEHNILEGFDTTTNVNTNSGVYFRRGDTGQVTIRNNKFRTHRFSIITEATISGRELRRIKCDFNEFESAFEAIVLKGTTTAALVPCLGNSFASSVTTKFGGGGGNSAGIEVFEIRDDTRISFDSAAVPTVGTYAVGDYARNPAPAVGQPKGRYCTVAGNVGTWVSEGNL